MATSSDKLAGTSNERVVSRTGKSWSEWLTLLDKEEAASLTHKDIAALLHNKYGLSFWWSQHVTVGFEQARGLRMKHERPDGFEISVSKTLAIPIQQLFTYCRDTRYRRRWLDNAKLTISRIVPGERIIGRWNGGSTRIRFEVSPTDSGKSRLVVQHGKLSDENEAARMKAYWRQRLNILAEVLTG